MCPDKRALAVRRLRCHQPPPRRAAGCPVSLRSRVGISAGEIRPTSQGEGNFFLLTISSALRPPIHILMAPSTIDEALGLVDALLAELKLAGATAPKQKAPPAGTGKAKAAPQNKKAIKAEKPPPVAADVGGSAELFAGANIQVGKCVSVTDHPNSDKLIKIEVQIGGGEVKKVCAGLKQYVTKEELEGSLVCVIVNLKAAKLGGEPSEAMILAADTPSVANPEVPIVKALLPPSGATPGDQIFLQGGSVSTSMPKTLKSDKWKKIVPLLSVQGGKACFDGTPLVVGSGAVTLPSEIPDGAGIH